MPKKSKISPAQRRDWLNRHENGERRDVIAKKDKVNPRTVTAQVERARLERAFDAAQQDQLAEALRKHQDDMLDLLNRMKIGITVPSLATEFAFERPIHSLDKEVRLPLEGGESNAITVILHGGSPGIPPYITLLEEDSHLWRALKEHLGNKNSLWRNITDWRGVLLKELQAREDLTNIIKNKIDVKYHVPILMQSKGKKPYFTPYAIYLIQAEAVSRSLGEPPSDFPSRLRVRDGSLEDPINSSSLTQWVLKPEKVKNALEEIVEGLVNSDEAKLAAKIHNELIACTRKAHEELDDYLLLHHIPGRCRLCKKLGGQ